eukprot:m.1667602 g.1667602  ORF g.1667602 m.1667602 type:complete len:83 (+) comp149086_c0_seq1:62-310(+)
MLTPAELHAATTVSLCGVQLPRHDGGIVHTFVCEDTNASMRAGFLSVLLLSAYIGVYACPSVYLSVCGWVGVSACYFVGVSA